MKIRIAQPELDRLGKEGASSYPDECCGLLIGRWENGEGRVVEEIRPMENARVDSPANRYLIRPEELLRAIREVETQGREVVGFYHSHPDVAAEPSAFDCEHAWPGYGYVIVSVAQGEPQEIRGWALAEESREFVEAEVMIADDSSPESTDARGAS
jgi:proteasome lid subunit RPN8/RPN11